MRQVQIPKYGPPEVLKVVEAPEPEPGPGQVRIAVRAAGVNFSDVLARKGMYRDAPPAPTVVGYEVAGAIDAVGPDVDAARVGQRVLSLTRFGGHSSQVVVPDANALVLPEAMTFEEAGALPVTYLTAHHMMLYLGNLHAGERILIHSAGGGVGIAAVQLARFRGAEIFGTASAGKHARLREMGVHHCIDYRTQDFEQEIARLTDGRGVHMVLDAIGGKSFRKSYRALGKNGRLFCFGISSFSSGDRKSTWSMVKSLGQMPIFHPIRLMLTNRSVAGVNLGALWDESEVMTQQMKDLLHLYREGVIAPVVDAAFPAEDAAAAHRYIEDRRNFGKVVLTF